MAFVAVVLGLSGAFFCMRRRSGYELKEKLRSKLNHIPVVKQSRLEPSNFLVLVLVTMAFVAVVLGLSGAFFCMRRRSGYELKEKLRSKLNHIPVVKQSRLEPSNFLVLVLVTMAFVAVVLGLSGAFFCMRRRSGYELKEKLVGMATDTGNDATATYQVRAGGSASACQHAA
ncbi:hypothetical protein PGIGA_G00198540 [Pangasianodon gigas]|uniref:Uncharacterized protein n=1 Tax=Pangasianodon gigas TaxID=30993 RepID=A0ACC5WDV0_PANGG|nr:hypothetical protein [Pangasianodon gigas]